MQTEGRETAVITEYIKRAVIRQQICADTITIDLKATNQATINLGNKMDVAFKISHGNIIANHSRRRNRPEMKIVVFPNHVFAIVSDSK